MITRPDMRLDTAFVDAVMDSSEANQNKQPVLLAHLVRKKPKYERGLLSAAAWATLNSTTNVRPQ
jgi:hypothetical protein